MLSSVRNIACILKSFRVESPELSLSELSRKLDIPKSTMFKLLQTMMAEGFLEKNEENGKYRPGRRTMSLKHTILSNSDLSNVAYPYLRSLALHTGLTAHLTCYENGEVIWLIKVKGCHEFPLYSRVGRRVPAYAPASGKAILAFLDAEQIDQLIMHRWRTLTPKTNTDKKRFLEELCVTKHAGFSIQHEEVDLGVASLAVPVFDANRRPVAGISVAGRECYFQKSEIKEVGAQMKQAAQEISRCI